MDSPIDKPASFLTAVEELIFSFSEPGVDSRRVDGFFQLFNGLGKCVVVKPELAPASSTDDANRMLQPSDLFLSYLAAVRARDWPRVSIIEHELRS
jgi:hypothetical protein